MATSHKTFESKTISNITESKTFRDVLDKCSFDSFVVLDLDNVTIESAAEGSLGSDQWFEQLLRYANEIIIDSKEAANLVLTLYNAVQFQIKAKLVEPKIARIIKSLQDIGIPVLALTARGDQIISPTFGQLKEVDIDFSHQWVEKSFKLSVDGHTATYCNGIIFCNGLDKGKCLAKLFEATGFPPPAHIIMLDDKEKNLIRVKSNVEVFCRFEGLRCSVLDEKVKNFDMKKATESLIKMSGLFSKTAQEAMQKLKIETVEEKPSHKLSTSS